MTATILRFVQIAAPFVLLGLLVVGLLALRRRTLDELPDEEEVQ